MSDGTSTHQGKNEIIIVKRRGGGSDEGHSGGVWKIAYADFMTAMMAFFLVMWLVNAANEESKASIASYFNPIKLMDEKPTDRGVKQVGNTQDGEAKAPKSKSDGDGKSDGQAADIGNQENSTAGEKQEYSESDYFENPYSVLAEIAQETGTQTNISEKGDGGAQQSGPASGASGGDAYRDPFDPDFWNKQVEQERQELAESQAMVDDDGYPTNPQPFDAVDELGQQDVTDPAVADSAPEPDASVAMAEADSLRDEIAKALGGDVGKLADGLTVTPTVDGLLVSITDQLDFGMFKVGSAVPERELVIAMEKIGQLLAKRPGAIAIRGHTDARPFTSGNDDNWRLSTARARSALFMLVRGGIAEERVIQVTGFADRRLKDPDNPYAEVNRRIEILVEPEGS
ncbi:flagellar motor protein MotB [Hoeflea sp. YIM 152468]|uniref:flagellar motor protein MotB n=1 Tax=Hoeflea sp. YIM 152468 TaxID=3031759 RepID=UPI0023DBB2BF|nr:flagellar motor protein MotB [Hoeflea sp. YIM 152468]MDF1610106.1 flagellar motor protein MotB [Hoeflea sp. YIM 152468]